MTTAPTPITFFGSDKYSATTLKTLLTFSQLQITQIITTNSPSAYPLHQLAQTHHLPITLYPPKGPIPLGTSSNLAILASFGHLLPDKIINLFPQDILCLHPSLLPQYRNVAPVPYAIALGDTITGITLFKIDNTIDNGKILAQQSAPILPTDTSPILLHRLFTLGAKLTLNYLTNPTNPPQPNPTRPLIFTHKLTSQSGFIEWDIILKLIHNQSISPTDTSNHLIQLRLSRKPPTTNHTPSTILIDLIRALDGWEKVWTIAPTKKGDLRLSFPYHPQLKSNLKILISGKPRPISWHDFSKYYL